MCRSRWQLIYKTKDLCAHCKKCFKDSGANVPFTPLSEREINRVGPRKCPDCGRAMMAVSSDFRPPRMTKKKEWAAIRVLAAEGHVPLPTHGCGCVWHPLVPKNVRQAQDMLLNGRIYLNRKTPGQLMLGTGQHRGKPLVSRTSIPGNA